MKIKVLQYIHSFNFAGAEEHILTLARNLDHEKFKIDIACPAGKVSERFKEEKLEKFGIDVVPIKIRGSLDFRGIWELFKLIRRRKYQIVHVHQAGYGGVSGRLAARLAMFPKIVVEETTIASTHYWIKNRIFLFLHIHILHKVWNTFFVDKMIAISNAVYESVIERERIDPKKVELIYYGIELDKFRIPGVETERIRKKLKLFDQDIVIGSIGRFTAEKGFNYLIDAFSTIIPKMPNVKLLLVGDGPVREQIESQINFLNLQDRVILTGWRRDIPELLTTFDIAVLPSICEAFGLVVVEAMASGVPVIATRAGGVVDIIENKRSGVLVSPRNETELAAAIEFLLMDKNEACRIGKRGREVVEEKFDSKIMAKNVGKFYMGILNKNE